MEVEFTKSFLKDVKSLKDKVLKDKIKSEILVLENTQTLYNLPNIISIVNSKDYYRIRVGDYCIGIKLEDNIVK